MGVLAAGVALGTAELLAALFGPGSSPIVAVGGAAVDASPEWLKSFAIRTFGERGQGRPPDRDRRRARSSRSPCVGAASWRRPRLGIVAPGGPGGDRRGRRRHPARERPGRRDPVDRRRARPGSLTFRMAAGGVPGAADADAVDPRRRRPRYAGYDRRRFLRAGLRGRRDRRRSPAVSAGCSPAARPPRHRGRPRTIPAPADAVPPPPDGVGPRRARRGPVPHAERRTSTGSTPRCSCPRSTRPDVDAPGARDGRPRDHARLRRAPRSADDRARHHARVRLERGRRALRRERALDRCAARRPPPRGGRARRRIADRVPLGRRIHDRHPDRGRRWTAGTRCSRSR